MRYPDNIDIRPGGRFLSWWREQRIRWEGEDGAVREYDMTTGAREVEPSGIGWDEEDVA